MKITKEIENRFLILYSIIKQNGKANKKEVLNFLLNNDLINLSKNDKLILETRKEKKWRNELAFVRQHLVKDNYLNNKDRNYWEITDEGKSQFKLLKEKLKGQNTVRILKNKIILEEDNLEVINSSYAQELFEDNLELNNETIEKKIKIIKRYKKLVNDLKKKYNSRCQISDCHYTFEKKSGINYSEGHHLQPLSQGGSQNDDDNVVILCANHHKMFRYANVEIKDRIGNYRKVMINNEIKRIEYKQ